MRQRTAQATEGTERVSRLATEVNEVQKNRAPRNRAVVYASKARHCWEQAAAAECQRYTRPSEGAAIARCKALSSTHYGGTITPRVRLAHQQVLQQRFTQEQHAVDAPYENNVARRISDAVGGLGRPCADS